MDGMDEMDGMDRATARVAPTDPAEISEGAERTHAYPSEPRWRMASSPCKREHGETPCATFSRGAGAHPLLCLGKISLSNS